VRTPKKIDPAVREQATRMSTEHRSNHATTTELAQAIAARERLGRETVCRWMVQAQV
jgi:transposase